jgi:hypothetical protein
MRTKIHNQQKNRRSLPRLEKTCRWVYFKLSRGLKLTDHEKTTEHAHPHGNRHEQSLESTAANRDNLKCTLQMVKDFLFTFIS